MRVFEESQKLSRFFPFLGATIMIIIFTFVFYVNEEPSLASQQFQLLVLSLIFTLLPFLLFFIIELKTRIDPTGISVEFKPFSFTRRLITWKEISRIEMKKYTFLSHGKRGYKVRPGFRAYTLRGKDGIQIVTNNNIEIFISTANPMDAFKTINYYREKHI